MNIEIYIFVSLFYFALATLGWTLSSIKDILKDILTQLRETK